MLGLRNLPGLKFHQNRYFPTTFLVLTNLHFLTKTHFVEKFPICSAGDPLWRQRRIRPGDFVFAGAVLAMMGTLVWTGHGLVWFVCFGCF